MNKTFLLISMTALLFSSCAKNRCEYDCIQPCCAYSSEASAALKDYEMNNASLLDKDLSNWSKIEEVYTPEGGFLAAWTPNGTNFDEREQVLQVVGMPYPASVVDGDMIQETRKLKEIFSDTIQARSETIYESPENAVIAVYLPKNLSTPERFFIFRAFKGDKYFIVLAYDHENAEMLTDAEKEVWKNRILDFQLN